MSRSNAVVRVKKVNSPALTYDSHFCLVKKIITGLGVLHFYTGFEKEPRNYSFHPSLSELYTCVHLAVRLFVSRTRGRSTQLTSHDSNRSLGRFYLRLYVHHQLYSRRGVTHSYDAARLSVHYPGLLCFG